MKTINEIQKEREEELSALFKSLGIFFAFSKLQFNEQRKKGVIYVDGGLGMIIPKENVKTFREQYDKLIEKEGTDLNANVPMDDFIYYELANHECFYTGDYGEILELVQAYYSQCTIGDIERVYFARLEAETN